MPFELLHLHRDRCPLCGIGLGELRAQCRIFFGELWCPGCGVRLWYLNGTEGCLYFDAFTAAPIGDEAIEVLAEILETGTDALLLVSSHPDRLWIDRLRELRVDSLDVVELTVQFEHELEQRLHFTGVL